MSDLLMLGLGAMAFAACAGYVAWCDRIIGPDPQTAAQEDDSVRSETPPVATRGPIANPATVTS